MTNVCTDPEHLADLGRCPSCLSIQPAVDGFIDDGARHWAVCQPCGLRWPIASWARSANEWAYAEMDAGYVAHCAVNCDRLDTYAVYARKGELA